MLLPPLLYRPDAAAYRMHFIRHYCMTPVVTFDSISVEFFPEVFEHAFYRDSNPTANDKAVFDLARAQRLNWIRAVLEEPTCNLYRRTMPGHRTRRIALEPTTPYAVIIQIDTRSLTRARFITAYIVDSTRALQGMISNPRW